MLAAWRSGVRSVAGRMFTGGGKTVVFANLINEVLAEFPGMCAMVLAHRCELIWQARDKIQSHTDLIVEVEMGEYKASVDKTLLQPKADVIVSTVQTQTAGGDGCGRIGKFNPKDFKILVVDEAHRAVSPSYRKTIDYYMTNPDLWVLGVTATPDRADEVALGQVFEMVPDGFDYDMNYGRLNGWLAEIDQQEVLIDGLDFSGVKATSDDLNNADLSAVMEKEKPLYGMVDAAIQIAGTKRGLGFSPSVAHAEMTASLMNRYKPGMAAFISGTTDKEVRKKINREFADGKIQWIWNCGTHTEGFDDCGIEVVVPKPTRSRALYEQMIGRGGRLDDSIAGRIGEIGLPVLRRATVARSKKPSFLVLDFYGNSGKHKLVTTFDILGGDMSAAAIEQAALEARKSGKPVRVAKSLAEEEQRQLEIQARREADTARKANVTAKASFKTRAVDPFDVLQIRPVAARGWDEGKQLSEKQRNVLRKGGYDPDQLDYARGRQLCSIICERWQNKKCSIKQAATLKRFGYTDAHDYSFEYAHKLMDAVAKNGWKRPEHFEAPPSNEMVGVMPDGDGIESDDVPF